MADNPNAAALAPGGAFQPLILPTLGESCGVQNQSWIVEDTTVLVENGVPEPVFSHQTLWRVVDNVDTLDQTFSQIQYTQTALGSLAMKSSETAFELFAVIAGYGKLSFSESAGVPYHVFLTSHDRLEITSPSGGVRKGTHKLASHVRLREIRAKSPSRSLKIAD